MYIEKAPYRTYDRELQGARSVRFPEQRFADAASSEGLEIVAIASTSLAPTSCEVIAHVALAIEAPDGGILWVYLPTDAVRKLGKLADEAEAEKATREARIAASVAA